MALILITAFDADPNDANKLNPDGYLYFDTSSSEFVYMGSDNETIVSRTGGGASQVGAVFGALGQGDFATPTFAAYLAGKQVVVLSYNAGVGMVFERFQVVNNDFSDWKCVSTGATAQLAIGNPPN